MSTRNARVIVELRGADDQPAMRWERSAGDGTVCELLGRAFEVTLRESDRPLGESLRAFFTGAMLHKADVAQILEEME